MLAVATSIRPARADDVARLETIENEADRLLIDRFGPGSWFPAAPGATRTAQPGFLLIAAEEPGGDAVGFAHVLQVDGGAHLEQLSVLPAVGRRGHGRALVEAAMVEAARRGHDRVTLRTFADIPWNAPFYASCGFVETEPDTAFLLGLVHAETRMGLDRLGRRVQMTAPLPGVAAPGPTASDSEASVAARDSEDPSGSVRRGRGG